MGNSKNYSSRQIYKWTGDRVIRLEVMVSNADYRQRLAIISKELYELIYQFQKIQSTSLIHQKIKPNLSEILISEETVVRDGKEKYKKSA